MLRLLRRIALPLLLARGVALGQARARPADSHHASDVPLALTHVTVIDATGSPAQPDMTVIISGGRITALGPPAKVAVPAGAHVVDATGHFLIPGLWDMHIHIDDAEFYAGNKRYATYPSQRDKEAVFHLLIANGVTGVRDMSGGAEVVASFSGQKCAALFDRFKRNGTWLCPTLHNTWRHAHNADSSLTTDKRARFFPQAFRQFWAAKAGDARRRTPQFVAQWDRYYSAVRVMIPNVRRAGVGLLAGSDAGASEYSVPGFSLHDELLELVDAGLTPMEALQTATLNPARYLGMTDALGTVELGKIADLVLLEANPLEDIRNTQKIAAVVVNGSMLGKPELQQILAGGLQNNSKARR